MTEPAPSAAPQQTAPQQTAPQQTSPQSYPGKTLGIVAIPVAVFFSLVGLILGVVANSQSKKAGYRNGPAKAAIWIGAILLVLSVIFWVAFGSLFVGLFNQCAQLGPGVHEVDGVTYTCS